MGEQNLLCVLRWAKASYQNNWSVIINFHTFFQHQQCLATQTTSASLNKHMCFDIEASWLVIRFQLLILIGQIA